MNGARADSALQRAWPMPTARSPGFDRGEKPFPRDPRL